MVTTEEYALRDKIEENLVDMFQPVRPFSPNESHIVDKYKDGSFGVSTLSFALYSNGNNLRGKSNNPFGLIYEDGNNLFSIGYFKRELDTRDSEGYITIVAPRGRDLESNCDCIAQFTEEVLKSDIPCKGIYARFLNLNQYKSLLNKDFLPIEESPWHPEAFKEDDTYNNSIVDINSPSKEIKRNTNRFNNFLKRNSLSYSLNKFSQYDVDYARNILKSHFSMLSKSGKMIGSTPEDHHNSIDLEILNLTGVSAWMGHLGDAPVSFFVGESLSNNEFGLYTGYTLREAKKLNFHRVNDWTGFTAIPTYSYSILIEKLKKLNFNKLNFGGSELPSLNRYKRRLGAKHDPTYWVFKPKN